MIEREQVLAALAAAADQDGWARLGKVVEALLPLLPAKSRQVEARAQLQLDELEQNGSVETAFRPYTVYRLTARGQAELAGESPLGRLGKRSRPSSLSCHGS